MRKSPKPRVVVDIQTRATIDQATERIVNLQTHAPQKRVRIVAALKGGILLLGALFFLFGSASAPITSTVSAITQEQAVERERLEQELAELEEQIIEYENQVGTYQQQGSSLKSEIKRLEANIAKINLQVQAINISLRQLDQEIEDTKASISETEEGIERNKELLIGLIKNIYEQDAETVMEILIKNPRLSDFFNSVNNLIAVQDGIRVSLEDILNLRVQLIEQQEELAEERIDVTAMKTYQDAQRGKIKEIQSEKENLLVVTKGKESEYSQLLEETKKTAAEIRNQIFKLLGGGELTFGEAYQIAKFASDATDIRPAFILAVLSQESAIDGIIGKNLGQCYYNDPRNNVSGTVMKDSQKSAFLALMKELNLDPNTTPVSCPIPRDGAYGGAMGPAQFIPTTWELFKNRIRQITGSNPPSPFSNGDAFVGTALYLKDAYKSSSCRTYAETYGHILPPQMLQERCAAAKYYAGGNWWKYRFTYGDSVVARANKLQSDIDILNE